MWYELTDRLNSESTLHGTFVTINAMELIGLASLTYSPPMYQWGVRWRNVVPQLGTYNAQAHSDEPQYPKLNPPLPPPPAQIASI